MDATCTMDIQSVPGVKNMLLGGEGIFNTVVHGPGRVLLQTMPINAVAGALNPYIIFRAMGFQDARNWATAPYEKNG